MSEPEWHRSRRTRCGRCLGRGTITVAYGDRRGMTIYCPFLGNPAIVHHLRYVAIAPQTIASPDEIPF